MLEESPVWLGEGFGEMLRAVADLDGDGFHELSVEEALGSLVHSLLANERVPLEILFAEDALHVTLRIAKRERNVTEAELPLGEVAPKDAPDIDHDGGVLLTGLGSNGHDPVVADRSAPGDSHALSAPCHSLPGSFLTCSV